MNSIESPFPPEILDTYASVYERDIDLVLVAATRAAPSIRAWLCEALDWPPMELIQARHSWTTSVHRESDIELRFGSPKELHVIQIENKLDAPFQPDQQAAYAKRASALAEDPNVAAAGCVLICPTAYARPAESAAFDAVLTYEEARDLLLDEGPWGCESALLLQHAILKHRRGRSQSPDDPARTEFFRRFAEQAEAAGLPRIPPTPRKPNAGFLWWPRQGTLQQPRTWRPVGSDGPRLVAKLVHGFVDIELTGIGKACSLDELGRELEALAVDSAASGHSLRIRRSVPILDPGAPIEEQQQGVDACIASLLDQRRWWQERGSALIDHLIRSSSH